MPHNSFEVAEKTLLSPANLTQTQLQRVLGELIGPQINYADLFFQLSSSESWVLEDGIVKEGSHNINKGVGIRAVSEDKTGFSYSNDIEQTAIAQAASAARSIAKAGQQQSIGFRNPTSTQALYLPDNPLHNLTDQNKVSFMRSIDAYTRSLDPHIKQVVVSLSGSHSVVLALASDGTQAGDIRPLVRLNVTVIVEKNGKKEQASAGGGGRGTYTHFFPEAIAFEYAREAVRQALVNLEAIPAPAGTMTVVLGPGWPGVLLHEAIGHGLEGDFNRKGSSAFSNRIGEQVASGLCTVLDDGTLPERRGSLNFDDEGTPTQCTTLIENGILKGYLQDKTNARLMKSHATGNGRRESFASTPMPRMTNTYLKAGESDPQEIIASVEKGIFAVNFGGGQVDITSGKFVFSASEAYLIEKGKVTSAIKGATLIGNGPDVLTRVTMVGNDLKLDTGVGTCGKEGQSVPVGVGQPTLKIESITVGGTSV